MAGTKNITAARARREDLLALSGFEREITITIDQGVVDLGNPEGVTNLRKGLVLVKNTSTGRYVNFDSTGSDGADDPATAVVLKYDVNEADERISAAAAYLTGIFNEGALIVDDAINFDWSKVQRLVKV